MIILDRAQIEDLIDLHQASDAIAAAYIAASRGKVTLPPVGHITFPTYDADCHIKFGHMHGDDNFVIKVATGFPQNAQANSGLRLGLGLGLEPNTALDARLPTGNGVSLVLSATTGALQAVLHDEMMLTDIRTGLGGALASRALARADATQVLVVGTGPQAIRQIECHAALIGDHLSFAVWGRSAAKAQAVVDRMSATCGLAVAVATDLETAVRRADVIITATGSHRPLIENTWVQPGTHITAVGADAPGKQELSAALTARADVLVADSRDQCLDHGEFSHAFAVGLINGSDVSELGTVISTRNAGRVHPAQITVVDLTGIAAQDIAIANVVLAALGRP